MISADNIISLYGAALATIIAVIQYRQWRKSQEILIDSSNTYHGIEADFEIVVTNPNSFSIAVGFVGTGVFYRGWLTPWRVQHSSIVSMYLVENGMLTSKGAHGTLNPGQVMDCHLRSVDFEHMDLKEISGFRRRLCVDVEHSAGSRSLVKVLGSI